MLDHLYMYTRTSTLHSREGIAHFSLTVTLRKHIYTDAESSVTTFITHLIFSLEVFPH